jgi:hypothetical protein
VVGRWVHLFRAEVKGDDPTMYFQRMSSDMRGINGEAAVSIDGGAPEIVDTYSADDIWPRGRNSRRDGIEPRIRLAYGGINGSP